jgi:hypothetical protein
MALAALPITLRLVPSIAFVEWNSVFLQQPTILFLKGHGLMMFFLSINVLKHRSKLTGANENAA